jgi:hypothetical protein
VRSAVDCACPTHPALRLREPGGVAMSVVRAYAVVTDSLRSHGTLDTLSTSAACAVLVARGCLEPFAFDFGLNGNVNYGFCYWGGGGYCFHCDYCGFISDFSLYMLTDAADSPSSFRTILCLSGVCEKIASVDLDSNGFATLVSPHLHRYTHAHGS